jgi:Hemerythrin HHE cation binding domain
MTTTDIIELILSDHRRIRQQHRALQDMVGRETGTGPTGSLAEAWDSLAGLIELHLCAEQEISWLPMCGTGPWGREQIAAAVAAAVDVREAISAARLQPAGSPAWRRAVNDALSACTARLGQEEDGILADFARRADRQARERLGRQWLAFTAALRLDQAPAGAAFAAYRSFW